jgi:prolipoprotein diacylglyceryl transferase
VRVASIPSPDSGVLELGPLSIHAYGLMIALGVVAAVWLFGRRLEASGAGTRDDASAVGIWGVVAGIIGARLYHVATEWSSFSDDLGRIPMIWKGGLGIPGGLVAGIAVGIWAAKRRGLDVAVAVTAAAPAIPLAQAIGRWGNWFNQELFGRPTDLPWGLSVSDETAINAGFTPGTTFHPTFLYESLWNLALCGFLIWLDRRHPMRPGRLMGVYVLGYGIGRFWVEGLRIDPADSLGGLRWNQWVAIAAVVGAAAYLFATRGPWESTAVIGTEAADPVFDDDPSDDTADVAVDDLDVDLDDDSVHAEPATSGTGEPDDDEYLAADERDDEPDRADRDT